MKGPWYKKPDEEEIIGANFNNRLASGDAIASAVIKIYDSAGDDKSSTVLSGSPIISDEDSDGTDDTASIKVINGTDGEIYRLEILATTSNGLKLQEDIIVKVRKETIP